MKMPLSGKFGLGFYSAFMVSNKVEVISKSYKDDHAGSKMGMRRQPGIYLQRKRKAERGTDVVLHINGGQHRIPGCNPNPQYSGKILPFPAHSGIF